MKKIIFGVLITLLVGINMLQISQFEKRNLTMNQLFAMNVAQAEDDKIYFVETVIEYGLCNECYQGKWQTCECERASTYCPSGGMYSCQYDLGIPTIFYLTCIDDGGLPC